ncbi:hypothetical protein ACIOJE_37855 [Kitasatospora sp. NPDC087861]|uniref:hypothetical protein n=1 Tax=Kitasatospora sp. NPDC087861 TaxID=3364070 RepID=UPI00380C5BCE
MTPTVRGGGFGLLSRRRGLTVDRRSNGNVVLLTQWDGDVPAPLDAFVAAVEHGVAPRLPPRQPPRLAPRRRRRPSRPDRRRSGPHRMREPPAGRRVEV